MRATTVVLFVALSGCTMPMTGTDTGPGTDTGSDGGSDAGAGDAGAGDSGAIDGGAGDAGSDAGLADASGTNPLCAEYCDTVLLACGSGTGPGQYADHAECLFACADEGWRDGTPSDTSGNTIHCRIYHATMAQLMPDVHCPHADRDGGGVCTD